MANYVRVQGRLVVCMADRKLRLSRANGSGETTDISAEKSENTGRKINLTDLMGASGDSEFGGAGAKSN